MTILKGTVPSLGTRLRQRLGDAWALNDEAADYIEQLEAALEDIVAADHCEGGEYCPHCIARNALAEDR